MQVLSASWTDGFICICSATAVSRMLLSRVTYRTASLVSRQTYLRSCQRNNTRSLFSWFKKSEDTSKTQAKRQEPVLKEDDLFHPFSKSPFAAIRARGEAIQSLAPCPVCSSHNSTLHEHTSAQPKAVKFECPNCGWPTHCTEAHWEADQEHAKYCARLREVNEDEHDLRSGRRIVEFEMPGECDKYMFLFNELIKL